MKISSAVLLISYGESSKMTKPVALCDISHLFHGAETIYNVKCENDIGTNYSENKQVLRLFTDKKSNEPETIRCIVSCKYDVDQKHKIVLRAAMDEHNKCVVVTPKKLEGLCGQGCSNEKIKEKMGSTTSRHSCKLTTFDDLVHPGDMCKFSCQTEDGEFLNTEQELRCTCTDGKDGRECDWTVGKEKQPIDTTNDDGDHLVPTLMNTRDDFKQCSTAIECSDNEYLAMTHPDYLYGNMLDYYMADPLEYGFNLNCIKRECNSISIEDIVCVTSDGTELKNNDTFPEGTRCGRRCDKPGYSYDHTPTDTHVGKEKYTSTTGGHGKYNFVPASDVVCTCGHQYSWPRQTHDYYGQFYPDEYYGSYCEWTYGSGPLSEYKPVVKKSLEPEPEQLGEGIQAAEYLAVCKPNFCNADMITDDGVKKFITNNILALYAFSDYGSNTENGFQHVQYSVNGIQYDFGFEDLWNFREISCPDAGFVNGDDTIVNVGTKCQLNCKDGYMWLPNDDRSDEVECIGMYGTYGVGAWNWMPHEAHPGYGSPRLDLRICVPNNYAERDGPESSNL